MLIVQDQVWNRVTINRSEGKATRYYIDEFHLLLKEEQTAAYSVEIWKRFRKWGGIPTGITQNVKDLLASREVANIFENSDFVYMLNQAQGDREILAKQLNICLLYTSILLSLCCNRSYLISCATRPTTNTAASCRFMFCLLYTSGNYRKPRNCRKTRQKKRTFVGRKG